MVNREILNASNERALRRLSSLSERVKRWISIFAIARLVSFVIALLCGAAAILDSQWLPYGPVACFQAVLFLIAVRLHRSPFALQPRVETAIANVKHRVGRLRHEWPDFDTGETYCDEARPELSELRVFGVGSVFQQINRSGLKLSQERLAGRLKNGLDPALISQIQASTWALMGARVFRRRMEVESRLLALHPDALEDTIRWAENREPPMANLGLLRLLFTALSIATLIQVSIALGTELETAWSITLIAQVLLFVLTTGSLGRSYQFMIGSSESRPLSALVTLFKRAEQMRFTTPYLEEVQRGLHGEQGKEMYRVLQRFDLIADRLSVRHGPMLHALLGILLGWEVHWVYQLQRWRSQVGTHLRASVEALSDLELVLGGCGFAEEVGQHCYPTVHRHDSQELPPLHFRGVGHPSIEPSVRRYNDFSLSELGELALVTGSNMSGKSTFLRTVGINVILAQGGFAVCAESATVAKCRVVSSIQVTDRPEEGLSRFHAEVRRLKEILKEVTHRDGLTLYLVDEMLSGTNSRERGIACRSVLRQLHGQDAAFGIVTTHDLELAKDREGPPLTYYHFADRFDGEALHFDYQLRDGVATTTNAIRVLEIEGIKIHA